MAQPVKNLPAIWETWVLSLGWEDLLEKGMATHSSILAWRIPWTVQSMGSQRVRHDRVGFTFIFTPYQTIKLIPAKLCVLSCVRLFVTPWTVALQAPLSMRLPRQEYWSGQSFPSPGDRPNSGIKPGSPRLQADSLPTEPAGMSAELCI